MIFTDTHTHLYDERIMADEQQVPRAVAAGVQRMYMPNCSSETIEGMLQVADKWPETCLPMMGLHPCYVKEDYEQELDIVAEWLGKRKFHAVGEIGLDYYWDKSWKEQQKQAFGRQIDMALEYDLPIVIHSRESTADCIELVRAKQNGRLTGVFHCFGGSAEEANAIIELGFFLGIGGVVTYKKSMLAETISGVGLQHIVLETDAPYLAPVPHRGKRNESSYIPVIAAAVAAAMNVTVEEVASVTTANAAMLFR